MIETIQGVLVLLGLIAVVVGAAAKRWQISAAGSVLLVLPMLIWLVFG